MNIYILKDRAAQGPYSVEQLVSMNQNGQCMLDTLAWHEGMTEWKPIHTIADVVDAIVPRLPAKTSTPLEAAPIKSPSEQVVKCSYCGAEYTKGTLACPLDGTRLSAEPLNASSAANASFLYIPMSRLITMCIISFGWYDCYWVYRNWRFLKERDNLTIRPFWRGISGLFYFYPLLLAIKSDSRTRTAHEAAFSPQLLAAGAIATVTTAIVCSVYAGATAEVPTDSQRMYCNPLVLLGLCLCFILPAQKLINIRNETMSPPPPYYRWSIGHTLCLIMGVVGWLDVLLQLVASCLHLVE